MRKQKIIKVKSNDESIMVVTPNGQEFRMTLNALDSSLLIHASTSKLKRIVIGYWCRNMKIERLNENGSIYSLITSP